MINFTAEQNKVVYYDGSRLKVIAGAGAGKTTILNGWCEANPSLKTLYLSYNAPIAAEASETFPGYVDCLTFHSLAYRSYGYKLRAKLKSSLGLVDVIRFCSPDEKEWASDAKDLIEEFILNAEVELKHDNIKVLHLAQKIWLEMNDPDSDFPITHDCYFKFYVLNYSLEKYDAVIVDEAQDLNAVKIDLVVRFMSLGAHKKVLLVGDSSQQINRWIKAEDALSHHSFDEFDIKYLQESFRFGPQVARVANTILSQKSSCDLEIVGKAKQTRVVFCKKLLSNFDDVDIEISQCAYLARTVMGAIDLGVQLANDGHKVYWVGGIDSYRLQLLSDLTHLKNGRLQLIKSPESLMYARSIEELSLKALALKEEGITRAIANLERFKDPSKLYGALKNAAVESEEEATAIISTSHRSKGRGWSNVYIHSDHKPIRIDARQGVGEFEDELHLNYVAVTRSKKALFIAEGDFSKSLMDVADRMFCGRRAA